MNDERGSGADRDPLEELRELAAAARALVEQHAAAGSFGLPCEAGLGGLDALLPVDGLPAAPARRAAPAFQPPAAPAFQPSRPHHDAPPAHDARDRGLAHAAHDRPAEPARPAFAPRPLGDAAGDDARAVATVAQSAAARSASTPPLPLEERRARLAVLSAEASACQRCVLCQQRKQAVFERGNPMAEIAFVGEGPGADEDRLGQPFVGKAGQLLDKMIAGMGYRPDDVYVCNIVKCRPPENRKPEPAEMAACLPFVTEQLALVRPRVIVALGATAVQGLVGTTEGITRLRGKWKLYKGATPVMPTFHPAYLLRQESAKRDVWNDLKEVLRHLGKTAPPPRR